MSRISELFVLTPTAIKGILALAFIAGLFGLDQLSSRVMERQSEIDLLRDQRDELQVIANAPDPSAMLEQTDARIADIRTYFLGESTAGLNAARLQMSLKQSLDGCGGNRVLIAVEPQDVDADTGLQSFLANIRFRASNGIMPDCLASLVDNPTFITIESLTWQRAGSVVMNVRAYAVLPDPASAGGTG